MSFVFLKQKASYLSKYLSYRYAFMHFSTANGQGFWPYFQRLMPGMGEIRRKSAFCVLRDTHTREDITLWLPVLPPSVFGTRENVLLLRCCECIMCCKGQGKNHLSWLVARWWQMDDCILVLHFHINIFLYLHKWDLKPDWNCRGFSLAFLAAMSSSRSDVVTQFVRPLVR